MRHVGEPSQFPSTILRVEKIRGNVAHAAGACATAPGNANDFPVLERGEVPDQVRTDDPVRSHHERNLPFLTHGSLHSRHIATACTQ